MAPKKKWPYRLVLVVWDDTSSCSAWRDPDDHLPTALIHTVGWVTLDKPKHITVVASLGDNGEFVGDVLTIPRGCIVSIKGIGGK